MNSAIEIAAAGPGVYRAIWLLIMALVLKLIMTVFTFGMKVLYTKLTRMWSNIIVLRVVGSVWTVHPLLVFGSHRWANSGHRNGTVGLPVPEKLVV